jgi:hypothetical protein
LTTAIGNATTLIESKTVGEANGNVSQGAKDDFQSVILRGICAIYNNLK